MNPKLSIIIPCYNCYSTLREAVDSCYRQGFHENEFEIVMVNDGSTDETKSLLTQLSLEHRNIRAFDHEKNRGGGATRNTAVSKVLSEIIFCLDSDDILADGALVLMYNLINQKNLDGVCLEKLISFKGDNKNNISHITIFPKGKTYELEDLIERNVPCGLNAVFMFTKNAFNKNGGYPESHGFDTQGFAWRFLAHGLKAQTCEGAFYYHRVNYHQSYYLREYTSGLTNINMKNVICEHEYLLKDEVRYEINKANILDFTNPLINILMKFPKVFHEDAIEMTKNIPPHKHDSPITEKPIKPDSIKGILFRLRAKIRNMINRESYKKEPRVCVVSFADGKFIPAQKRLLKSLKDSGYQGGILFANTIPEGCPPHNESPWGFKPYLMDEARRQGYEVLIWLDSAIQVYKPLKPLIDRTIKRGVFGFSRSISSMGAWTSDFALSKTGLSREESYKIPDVISIVIGIDVRNPKGKTFLSEWRRMAEEKDILLGVESPLTLEDTFWNDSGQLSPDPKVRGHRHDQPVLSLLHHKLKIKPNSDLIFDITSEAKPGEKYAKYLPLNTILVENRDFKLYDTPPLTDLSGYRTSLKSTFFSSYRLIKDWIRKILILVVKKPETAVTLMSPHRILYHLKNKRSFKNNKTRPV